MTIRRTPALSSFLPDGRTRLLGIVGEPIDHSLSPRLQSEVLRRLDRNMLYVPVPVSSPRLGRFLRLAADLGFVGCNVTTPFKERVLRVAEPGDVETRRTAMANTLTFRPGKPPLAEGTDGRGVLGWLDDHGLGGLPFGVLGFGATARSLVHAAWSRGTPPDCIVTRRVGSVRKVLGAWKSESGRGRLRGPVPEVRPLASMDAPGPEGGVPVWVSTWPPGVLPPKSFWSVTSKRCVILDMNYGAGRTTLADEARAEGRRAADGLGPLLQQAARSLSIWLGEPVDPDLFRRAADVPVRRLRPSR